MGTDNWIAIVSVICGVGAGLAGFVGAQWIDRKRAARVSARIAWTCLDQWCNVLPRLQEVKVRFMHENVEVQNIHMALALWATRDLLDQTWWNTHGLNLADRATREQWDVLVLASRHTSSILSQIAKIDNKGTEAFGAQLRFDEAQRRLDIPSRETTRPSPMPVSDDPEDARTQALMDCADRLSAELARGTEWMKTVSQKLGKTNSPEIMVYTPAAFESFVSAEPAITRARDATLEIWNANMRDVWLGPRRKARAGSLGPVSSSEI